MVYKNMSHATKTFYGVTFKPGDQHDVPGYINDPKFVRLENITVSAVTNCAPAKKSATTKGSKSKVVKEEAKQDGSNCD